MKKTLILFLLFTASITALQAQKFITKTGHIKFFSDAPTEDIEANNHSVNSALDIKTGDFVFKVLMKSFEFKKALMQEHFNENYVESDKFPNATFVGKITNLSDIDFTKDGTYKADVEGDLTIHGITQKIKESGSFIVSNGEIHGNSVFKISLSDYNIKIPKAVSKNIAEEIEITVDVILKELKK